MVLKLSDKANPNWLLKDAKKGAKIFSDRDYKFMALPKETTGAKYLLRDSEQSKSWLPNEGLTTTNKGAVYALIRWKYLGKEVVTEVDFAKLERGGWTEVKGDVETTFPGGEDWRWKALKKDLEEGDVILQLDTLDWGQRVVLFLFK
jgi:hypothetical protein